MDLCVGTTSTPGPRHWTGGSRPLAATVKKNRHRGDNMAAIRGDLVAIAASDGEQIVNPRADRDIGINMVSIVPTVLNSEVRHLGDACRTDQTDA